jgi:hypothetical protein
MSIARTMQRAARHSAVSTATGSAAEKLRSRRRATAEAGADEPPASRAASIASELTTYIPAEAVALYTGVLPFLISNEKPLQAQDTTGRWILAGAVAALAVAWAAGVYRQELRARGKKFRFPLGRTALMLIAYAAWIVVVPGSPFNAFDWYTPAAGAIAGLVAISLISLLQLWLDAPDPAT